ARNCRLHRLLARPDVDDGLLDQACVIVDQLLDTGVGWPALTDYDHGGDVVDSLVGRLAERGHRPVHFITVDHVRSFLVTRGRAGGDRPRGRGLSKGAPFDRCGLDSVRIARITAACDRLLADERWPAVAQTALASADPNERYGGCQVSRHLGVDLHDYCLA